MFRKKSICSVTLSFLSALLLSASLSLVNSPIEVSAANETHNHDGYTDWTQTNSLPASAGSYLLKNDVNLTGSWKVVSQIDLCLNGHNIIFSGGNCITINNGGSLTIDDCTNTQHKFSEITDSSNEKAGLWVLDEINGTNVVTGGCIMGINPAAGQTDGIGIFLNGGGFLNLNGGNIVGSYASYSGGGVIVCGNFTMNGGSICGNKAGSYGGGVKISSDGTFTMNDGSITNNVATYSGGGVYNEGTFTMNGGTIAYNKSTDGAGCYVSTTGSFNLADGNIKYNVASNNGGGIENSKTFNMTGGKIANNQAGNNGGGLYCYGECVNILTGGEIKDNDSTTTGGVYYRQEMCLAKGTPITMADGSKMPIENLEIGDSIRVFDHDLGQIATSKIFDVWAYPEKHSDVVDLHFSHDIDLSIVYGHSFFERDENRYVAVTKDNVDYYVGHEFYNVDDACWETLEGYDFVDGKVDTYVITSEYNLNSIANGMLSNEDGFYSLLTNIFEFDENLKIDADEKANDIAEYGLYSYDRLAHVSKHVYDALNLQYLNVAFGKRLISEEQFNYLEAYYAAVDPELYCDSQPKEQPKNKQTSSYITPLGTVTPPSDTGMYLGGSIKIYGNNGANLYLCSGKVVTIGTGTEDDGNGVVAPNENMYVGVTMQDEQGIFTTNGSANDVKYFFGDEFAVLYDNEGYLKLDFKSVTISEEPQSYTYDGTAKAFAITGSDSGLSDLKVEYYANNGWTENAPINAGYYDVKITRDGDATYNSYAKEIIDGLVINKAAQNITISDIEKVYDNSAISVEEYSASRQNNYYQKLGDGVVTVEYKLASETDSKYTTTCPVNAGNYVVRVSVAEGTNYLAGSNTKQFSITAAKISNVTFGDINEPTVGETAPAEVINIPIDAKYSGTISWSPALNEGKFACNTVYTVTVTLDIASSANGNYEFANDVTLANTLSSGWVKSSSSTATKLIYTKSFAATTHGSLIKVPSKPATSKEDGYKDAWKCSICGQYFEDEAGTKPIGDENAYNNWKANDGYLAKLPNNGLSGAAIAGISIGSLLLILLIIYACGYFFLFRRGKLDDRKIKVIYKILPRGKEK